MFHMNANSGKDILPFVESFSMLAEALRVKGWQFVFSLPSTISKEAEKAASSFGLVVTIDEKQLKQMDFIDVFFVMDYCRTIQFPQRSKVIGCIHALQLRDINAPATVYSHYAFYATCFDYTFMPQTNLVNMHESALIPVFTDRFPSDMILRSSKNFCIIPAGYLKLDTFIQHAEQRIPPPDSLLFAPTHIKVNRNCKDFIDTYGKSIVASLLNHFPEYNIIFRPAPTDRHHTAVQKINNEFSGVKQFIFDDGQHLKGVYARSALLVSDGSHAIYSFSMATLNPFINCLFGSKQTGISKKQRHVFGYNAYSIEQMVSAARDLLGSRDENISRIRIARDRMVCNPGRTATYLADHIEHITSDKRVAEWKYIPRQSKVRQSVTLANYVEAIQKFASTSQPDEGLRIARTGLRTFPNTPLLHALEAKLLFILGDKEGAHMAMTNAFHANAQEALTCVKWEAKEVAGYIDKLLSEKQYK